MNSTNYYRIPGLVFSFVIIAAGCTEDPGDVLHVGQTAPSFALDLTAGGSTNLNLHSGKGVAITFMSSWCPCSNDSVPMMKQAYANHQDDGLMIIMVGIQDSREKFGKFVEEWAIPFPAGYDKGDRIASDYGVRAPPTTVFVDKNGIVQRVFYGNIKDQEENFHQWIEELL
jgi:peroxiredoxin